MSALTCVVRFDGGPASAETARRMVDRMPWRGPDGRDVWSDGTAALGHAMLHTTPESIGESLPLVRGPLALTADVRLDNRPELLARLSADLDALGLSGPQVPDSALVLAAYARWGDTCPEHLLGDFVFALWDARRRTLVCARDPFGVRQLFVHQVPGRLVAVASEPKALFALPEIVPELDEARLADHLSARLYDPVGTVFRNVTRLRPGHVLVVSEQHVHEPRYWTLTPDAPTPPDQTAERFAELFEEAVRCRVRCAFPVGAELSGGLDSSAVAAVAARVVAAEAPERLPLHMISLAYDDPAADERPYVQAVLDGMGSRATSTLVFPEREQFVELHDEILARLDDGRVRGNGFLNYLTARAAARQGVRVLLTGQDGDSTVGHGWEWFSEQAIAGNWEAVRAQAEQMFSHLQSESHVYRGQVRFRRASEIASLQVAPVLRWYAEEGRFIRFDAAARGLARHFGTSRSYPYRLFWKPLATPRLLLRHLRRKGIHEAAREAVPPTLRPEIARRTALAERLAERFQRSAAAERGVFSASEAQRRLFESEYVDGNLAKLDLYPALLGVEARHPFMDTRLVQFALSLTAGDRLRDGWTRSILRRAMEPDLPPLVLQRMNKMDFAGAQRAFLLESDAVRIEALLADPGPAEAVLDIDAVRALWARGSRLTTWERAWLSSALSVLLWMASPGCPLRT